MDIQIATWRAVGCVALLSSSCTASSSQSMTPRPVRPECMEAFDRQYPEVRQELGITNAENVTVPPRRTRAARLAYPEDMRRQGVEGSVLLAYVLGTGGQVSHLLVVDFTHAGFIQPARDLIESSRFEPAKRGAVTSPVFMCQDVSFSIRRR